MVAVSSTAESQPERSRRSAGVRAASTQPVASTPTTLGDIAIVVPTRNAQSTIASVLDRIPTTIAEHVGAIVVSDDASSDATVEVARRWAVTHQRIAVTVVRQPRRLGPGGNQKFCYRWVLDHGHHVAAVIDGDARCAPELIGTVIGPLLHGEADAVFGSHVRPKGATRVGRPLQNRSARDRILTAVQNLCAGTSLSEWHSGYRAYDLRCFDMALVHHMSDGFHFDTELILSLGAQRRRIAEIAIPAVYGDEFHNVSAVRSAVGVVTESVKLRARRNSDRSWR